MLQPEQFLGIGTLSADNIEFVAAELRRLLAQPYRFLRRNRLLGTPWSEVRCLAPDTPALPSVLVERQEGLLVISVHDPRYEDADWEVPEGSGFCRGAEDELYFRAVGHGDLEYHVRLL